MCWLPSAPISGACIFFIYIFIAFSDTLLGNPAMISLSLHVKTATLIFLGLYSKIPPVRRMKFSTWSSRMWVALAKYWTTCTPPILTSTKIMSKPSWTLLCACRFQTFRACAMLSSSLVLHQRKFHHFLFQACWALSTTAFWGAVFLMILSSTVPLKPRGLASAVT